MNKFTRIASLCLGVLFFAIGCWLLYQVPHLPGPEEARPVFFAIGTLCLIIGLLALFFSLTARIIDWLEIWIWILESLGFSVADDSIERSKDRYVTFI